MAVGSVPGGSVGREILLTYYENFKVTDFVV
jgi:hypothetical protein